MSSSSPIHNDHANHAPMHPMPILRGTEAMVQHTSSCTLCHCLCNPHPLHSLPARTSGSQVYPTYPSSFSNIGSHPHSPPFSRWASPTISQLRLCTASRSVTSKLPVTPPPTLQRGKACLHCRYFQSLVTCLSSLNHSQLCIDQKTKNGQFTPCCSTTCSHILAEMCREGYG